VRGTAHLWPWSWHSYGPIRIKFWTGQRGLIKASSMKFQQNVWNLSWNVLKRQKMAFNEVGFVIISITKNTNGRLALRKSLSYRVMQNFYWRQLHYLSVLHEQLENKQLMTKSVCCVKNTLTNPNEIRIKFKVQIKSFGTDEEVQLCRCAECVTEQKGWKSAFPRYV